ncbi:RNF32 [Symbiodinium necroappetens]|uniref:RNF32 protein n=1 Tax=Symbiodinium necroappetens TaxID=1628268 RepID=A0A812LSK5_9DINO|nr:RNF32 [Symbiodinium necroappetens]
MRSRGTRPDVVTFNTTISACASGKKWAEALQLLEEGKKLPSGPDQMTYGAAISACEDHWELALHLLNDMSASKLQLNEVTSASTIRACSNGDNPESAIELLRALQQKAVRQNVVTYTSAMAALGALDSFLTRLPDEWPPRPQMDPKHEEHALALVQLCHFGLHGLTRALLPSRPTADSIITLLLLGQDWLITLRGTITVRCSSKVCGSPSGPKRLHNRQLVVMPVLLQGNGFVVVPILLVPGRLLMPWPLILHWSTPRRALESLDQLYSSRWLLSKMKDDAVEMDIGLFNAAMGVCREAHGFGHLRKRNIGQVEQLFKDVQYHRLKPDVVTYSHVMAAVREAGEWERVLEVLDEAFFQSPARALTAITGGSDATQWQYVCTLAWLCVWHGPLAREAVDLDSTVSKALLLARGMTDIHLSPGVVSYTAMMSACTHGGMWQSTLRLLDMLQAAGEAPNYVTMTAVIKACMTNTNWTFALHWKSILDKLGVSGYFTTYTYLIWLCAEAEQWDWVEYLMAESTTRFPNAENFDQRQAGHVAELPDLNVPGFRLPPEASEDPSLMRSDAAASQSAPSVFAESVWQRRFDEPGTLAGQGDSTGSANFQVADSEDWAGVLEPSNSFKGQAELDYDEKLKRHEASLTLAQRLGLVAKPAQPLTHEQWEQVKHASDSRQDSEVPCSICLEDFRTRPQVILSCSHVFHGECLRSFERFSGKRYCPLCRCPYFDATIHYSGLMVWRKKSASRIQRAWRGYRSRGEIFLQLRQPQLRAEAPTLSRPCARCESCALLWPLSTYAARAPFLEHIARGLGGHARRS